MAGGRVFVALFITVLLMQDVLASAAVASRASKLARRNQRHKLRSTATTAQEAEALGFILEIFEWVTKGHDVYLKVDDYRRQVGCKTPPMIPSADVPNAGALTDVFVALARKVYDECGMVQRINFLRAWGATAWGMLQDNKIQMSQLPTISASDCQPLLLTVIAMSSLVSTLNCDEMFKSNLYYSQVCQGKPDYTMAYNGCINRGWLQYCQNGPGDAGGCDFEPACKEFMADKNFVSKNIDCFKWRANID